jgi:hypothetical protein
MRCIANTKNGAQCKKNSCVGKLCGIHRKLRDDIQLVNIEKAHDGKHKFIAHFLVNGKEKSTRFGAEGYQDYTMHGDRERMHRYNFRHTKDLRTNDPTRAGFLSVFILWNKPTLQASIDDYKRRLKSKDFSLPK